MNHFVRIYFLLAISTAPISALAQSFWASPGAFLGDWAWSLVATDDGTIYALTNDGIFRASQEVQFPYWDTPLEFDLIYGADGSSVSDDSDTVLLTDYKRGLFYSKKPIDWEKTLPEISLYSSLVTVDSWYVGGGGGQLFVSTDTGRSWTVDNIEQMIVSDEGIDAIFRNSRAAIYLQDGTVFANNGAEWAKADSPSFKRIRLVDDKFFALSDRTIYSSDDGFTWTQYIYYGCLFGISDFVIRNETILLLCIGDWLYHSEDGGENWSIMSDIADKGWTHSLAIDGMGFAYLAIGDSVLSSSWSLDETLSIGVESATSDLPSSSPFSIYPNPISDSAFIEGELSDTEDVSVIVYDLLGREVDTIYDSRGHTGVLQFRWTPSLPSGLYVVRIHLKNRIETHSVVVMN